MKAYSRSPQVKFWAYHFYSEHHLVQTGNDPLLLLARLAERLVNWLYQAKTDYCTAITEMDATELYISLGELSLISDASEKDIREVFWKWVEDECKLEIVELEQSPKSSFKWKLGFSGWFLLGRPEINHCISNWANRQVLFQSSEKIEKNKRKPEKAEKSRRKIKPKLKKIWALFVSGVG